MKLALDHWHIEPSSVCTLKCPRCPRAETSLANLNKQLSLQFFVNNIGKEVIEDIKKITFCGNNGDPIYCKELIKIIHWIKEINPKLELVLITNGSHKPKKWWKDLALILSKCDEIHWSIDGWDQQSNEMYRINSDWNSITDGIAEFKKYNSTTYTNWAAIVFKFNEDNLDKIKDLATSLHFDNFQLTLSTKFGSKYPSYGVDDTLEPSNKNYIPNGCRFERIDTKLSNKVRPGNELKKIFKERAIKLYNSNEYPALCYIGNKGVFLNSQGEFYPCCWVANNYPHNARWMDLAKDILDINKQKFVDILSNKFWKNEFLKFNSLECSTKCIRQKLLNTKYISTW
jgi:MoaA/NifB/PqqE/SkfB family radical SAM enzyme